MKRIKAKKLTKQIICIIVILMLSNFIMPNIVYGSGPILVTQVVKADASLVETIGQFLCYLFDATINLGQNMFVTPDRIRVGDGDYSIKYSPGVIFSGEVPAFDINYINTEYATDNLAHESTAITLQPVISTWYNALRRIALVGLLSVIVYIGIRILLSSTSAKDKAKYKAMLKDWLVAICLLFTLHYIMSITVTIVQNINQVVKVSTIAENGEDILMTNVRNSILHGEKWDVVMPNVLIYSVLVVYTIIYTIQYLRRTIYIAFLTMIAPLITLTYPLDKIKDNRAQAFDMWIKDYVFFSLIQVIHLAIYYIFLGNAIDLTNEGNWLYAIVSVVFISIAEKLIKKMFGFNKSKSIGSLGAGATGALVMNAINKVPKGASKGGSLAGGNSAGGNSAKLTRTAGVNPFVNFEDSDSTIPENSENPQKGPKNNSEVSGDSKHSSANQQAAKAFGKKNGKKSSKTSSELHSVKSTIKGAMAVTGHYLPKVAGTTIRTMAGVAGGVFGFTSAIIDEKDNNVVRKTLAGYAVGKGTVDMASNAVRIVEKAPKEISEKIEDAVDTYREGAYGKEVAQNAKFDRVFRNSREYEDLKATSGFKDKEFEQKLQTMLDAGIDDAKQMKKIFKNHRLEPHVYSMEDSIKYSKMAKKCPESIIHDNVKFIKYCQDRKINLTSEELTELRKTLVRFK